jgi:SAM-dependent methyltransferase
MARRTKNSQVIDLFPASEFEDWAETTSRNLGGSGHMGVNWATPLYEFLRQCNASHLTKEVLDCGAGGNQPPLSMFCQYGYKTFGIEISERALAEAKHFCEETGMALNILRGNMRHLPFADTSFSFTYSYNAIFFNSKPDIASIMSEIERVLRSDGLCFVNFLSVDDPDRNIFCSEAKQRFHNEGFSYHEDDEADAYFANFELLRKEKRSVEKFDQGKRRKQVTLEYIARKR